jgi:hypothetical protein
MLKKILFIYLFKDEHTYTRNKNKTNKSKLIYYKKLDIKRCCVNKNVAIFANKIAIHDKLKIKIN